MQRGINSWVGAGNVASDVSYGQTHSGDDACNFRVAIEQAHKNILYIRVNVYSKNTSVCRMKNLKKGDYVVVEGELMNRMGKDDVLIEIRCKEIVITDKYNRRDRNDGYGNKY